MEEYNNHYYVVTEVFNDEAIGNYVMHTPMQLLSVVSQLYSDWADDSPTDYQTEIEFENEN